MTTKNIPIEEASDDQLRSFAANILQLELGDDVRSRAQLLAKIDTVWKQAFVQVEELPELVLQNDATAPVVPVQQLTARYADDPKVELTIGNTSYPGGKEPVPVSVNGSPNLVIQRERRVALPYRFYLALLEAHEVQTIQEGKELVETRITNYPVQIHKLPSDEEVAAWHERTKDVVLGG